VQQIVNYWVQIENDSKGPFTKQQLRAMLEKGALSPRHLAAPEGSADWLPLILLFPSAHSKEENPLPTHLPARKTLIRLPVFLLILAVAAILGIVGLWFVVKDDRGALANSKIIATEKRIHETMGFLMSYHLWAGSYPSEAQGLLALVEQPTTPPIPGRWERILDQLPLDAWERPFVYRLPNPEQSQAPEIISLGPDGILGTEDDLSSKAPLR
jgi:general secretion pathway protein G